MIYRDILICNMNQHYDKLIINVTILNGKENIPQPTAPYISFQKSPY